MPRSAPSPRRETSCRRRRKGPSPPSSKLWPRRSPPLRENASPSSGISWPPDPRPRRRKTRGRAPRRAPTPPGPTPRSSAPSRSPPPPRGTVSPPQKRNWRRRSRRPCAMQTRFARSARARRPRRATPRDASTRSRNDTPRRNDRLRSRRRASPSSKLQLSRWRGSSRSQSRIFGRPTSGWNAPRRSRTRSEIRIKFWPRRERRSATRRRR